MKRLLLLALLALPLLGCGEKPAEAGAPSQPLPKEAGSQKMSYTGGGK